MIQIRRAATAIAVALCFPFVVVIGGGEGVSSYAETAPAPLRPEVGNPLAAAQELAAKKKYQDALAKVSEAEAVPKKTDDESYLIDRVRASIAAVAGDNELAIKSIEKVVSYNRLAPGEEINFVRALIGLYAKQENHPKTILWIDRYYKDGGNDPAIRTLLIQNYYLNNDFAKASQELRTDIQAAEKAGKVPDEASLQLLKSCAIKQNDKNAYLDVLEKFIAYYPNKEYWGELLDRSTSKSMLPERLALDLFRLKRAVGQLNTTDDYMNMSILASLEGYPAEAKAIVDEGLSSGVLSLNGEGGRAKRQRDKVYKEAAEDEKALNQSGAENTKGRSALSLLKQGYAYVTIGQADKGLAMMEQGIHQGGLKQPDDAKLLLAYAYVLAARKEQAIQILKTVQGTEGAADLARYWILHLNHSST
jgi:hypothetical protein